MSGTGTAADEELAPRVISGARWLVGSTILGTASTWVTTIVLARLLTREEFGLAAIALLTVSILALFQDSGLHAALIHRRERIQAAVDTAAVYAPLSGIALGAMCFALAPLSGRFFHQPHAQSLVQALAAVLVLRSFAVVPNALLQKEFLFDRQSLVVMSGGLLQSGATIAFAVAGFGAWSVIGGQLVQAGWSAVLLWPLCPYRPHPRRASFAELRSLLRYGRNIVAGNVVGFVNSSTDVTLVGRLYGAIQLGTYSLGFQTGRYAVTTVTRVTNAIVFPAYAKLQHDPDHFRRAYLRSLRFIAAISMPAALGLAAVSNEVIRVAYGSKWSGAVPVLALIAFHGLFLSVSATTGEVFKASGRPQFFFQMGLLQVVLLFAFVAVLYPFGIVGFAGARAGATFVMAAVILTRTGRLLGIHPREWLRAIGPSFAAGAVMAAGVTLTRVTVGMVIATATWPVLAGLIVEGALLYALAMAVLGRQQWNEFLGELARLFALASLRRRLPARRRPHVAPGAPAGKHGS